MRMDDTARVVWGGGGGVSSTEIMISILLQRLLSFNSLAIRDGGEKLLRHVGTQLMHSAAGSVQQRGKKKWGGRKKIQCFPVDSDPCFRVSA